MLYSQEINRLSERDMRANSIHLSESQMWDVAKYLIEHKGVVQDEHGDFLKFRVSKKTLGEEVSKEFNLIIGAYQVEKCIKFHDIICKLVGQKPIVPPPQESVQEDILKTENKKLKEEIRLLIFENKKVIDAGNVLLTTANNYKERLNQIRKLGTV